MVRLPKVTNQMALQTPLATIVVYMPYHLDIVFMPQNFRSFDQLGAIFNEHITPTN